MRGRIATTTTSVRVVAVLFVPRRRHRRHPHHHRGHPNHPCHRHPRLRRPRRHRRRRHHHVHSRRHCRPCRRCRQHRRRRASSTYSLAPLLPSPRPSLATRPLSHRRHRRPQSPALPLQSSRSLGVPPTVACFTADGEGTPSEGTPSEVVASLVLAWPHGAVGRSIDRCRHSRPTRHGTRRRTVQRPSPHSCRPSRLVVLLMMRLPLSSLRTRGTPPPARTEAPWPSVLPRSCETSCKRHCPAALCGDIRRPSPR